MDVSFFFPESMGSHAVFWRFSKSLPGKTHYPENRISSWVVLHISFWIGKSRSETPYWASHRFPYVRFRSSLWSFRPVWILPGSEPTDSGKYHSESLEMDCPWSRERSLYSEESEEELGRHLPFDSWVYRRNQDFWLAPHGCSSEGLSTDTVSYNRGRARNSNFRFPQFVH